MSDNGYNGPGRRESDKALGEYMECRFQQMRWASKTGNVLRVWESRGGKKKDIQFGYDLAKATQEERAQKVGDQHRVLEWSDLIRPGENGQWSFADMLERPHKQPGAGGHQLGSFASTAMATIEGYKAGKDGSTALADCPYPPDSAEAGRWAEGFGQGLEDRPPPKPEKESGRAGAASNGADAAPRRRRGRLALGAPEVIDVDPEVTEDLPDAVA